MRGFPLGYSRSGKVLRYEVRRNGKRTKGESSMFLCGPARSGKTSVIMRMLHGSKTSNIVPDVKAQLSCILARHLQRMGHRVVFINPLNEQAERLGKFEHVAINPLEGIDVTALDAGLQADYIGENIIVMNGNEREPHWPESARDLISGVTLAVLEYEDKKDLVTVYERVCGPGFFEYARAMVERGNPLIENRLGRFAGEKAYENKEFAGIHSTAVTHFRFMGNQAVMDCFRPSRNRPLLRWADLRKRLTTVFPIVPVKYLSSLGRFLRLTMGSALSTLVSNPSGLGVFLPWDEFPACGKMAVVTDVMSLSAGLNLVMMPVIQNTSQLKIYGDQMDSFMSIAGCQIYLPPRDPSTAQMISGLSGQTEVIARSNSVSFDQMGFAHISESASQHARAVLLPDEVVGLPPGDMLIKVENVPDIIHAVNKPYYRDSRFGGLDPDPYHAKGGR